MTANLIVLIAVAGCVGYLYLKANLVKSISLVISAILASVVAFSYFELVANIVITKAEEHPIVPWAHAIFLVFLFALVFVIFQVIAFKLLAQPVDMGLIAEKAGRLICGLLLGLIISGIIITALALGPLPEGVPYSRYDRRADLSDPKSALFGADSFAVAWARMASVGGLSGSKSFATVHADFLDQIHLNRLVKNVEALTITEALEIPRKNAAWIAPENLANASDPNETVAQKSGFDLTIVRVGIKAVAIRGSLTFTPSQVRLICKLKQAIDDPLSGKGINVYPAGFMKDDKLFYVSRPSEKIIADRGDMKDNIRWYDFGFHIPKG